MDLESAKSFGVLSNVLLVLILIFITVYSKYKTLPSERPTFIEDVKDCMKTAMKYVVGATLAIGIYYGVASNDIEVIREERIRIFSEQIATEEGTSREDLLKKNKENVETFVSIKTQLLGGFVTLTFVSFVYSLLAVLIWRTIMKRN
jgi:hypothetical protein